MVTTQSLIIYRRKPLFAFGKNAGSFGLSFGRGIQTLCGSKGAMRFSVRDFGYALFCLRKSQREDVGS